MKEIDKSRKMKKEEAALAVLYLLVSPSVSRRRVKVNARKGAKRKSSIIFISPADRVG